MIRRCLVGGLLLAAAAVGWSLRPVTRPAEDPTAPGTWRDDWEVADGYVVESHATGFALPVNLAFVPEPAEGPKAPLYFVVELRGRIKVVLRDGSVETFAEGFTDYAPPEELPSWQGENGACGICLDPATGHVFVTFVRTTERGDLHNAIARFDTIPGTFGTRPTARKIIDRMFRYDPAARAHQIGPCRISGGALWVCVGDGEQPSLARKPRFTYGKLLRMSSDGAALADNPHYDPAHPEAPAGYVWARGLRNPFGLVIHQGQVIVSDVGPTADRILTVRRGDDCLYDGTDWSIGSRADIVFPRTVSPVSLDVHPADGPLPALGEACFVALSGGTGDDPGPGKHGKKALAYFGYDFTAGRSTGTPAHLLRYRGRSQQLLTGVAVGPDGVYVSHVLPDREGQTRILRIRHAPDAEYPHRLSDLSKYREHPELLLEHRGCTSCHRLDDAPAGAAPSLERSTLGSRIDRRVNGAGYAASLEGLGPEHADARAAVLELSGHDRVREWVTQHLLAPRFDNPDARMPDLGLSPDEARLLSTYLVGAQDDPGAPRAIERVGGRWLGPPSHRLALLALLVGLLIGLLVPRRRAPRATEEAEDPAP